MKSIQVFGRPR